jgi:hypothetical protein
MFGAHILLSALATGWLEAGTKVIIALIGLAGTIGGAVIAHRYGKKEGRKTLIRAEQSTHFRLIGDIKDFLGIEEAALELFNKTEVDRFLILVAVNGVTEFRAATCIYEQQKAGEERAQITVSATSQYVNFEFDHYYRQMLKDIEARGSVIYQDVNQMPDSDLKSIYKMEGVKKSKVLFLRRAKNYDGQGNDMFFYCSAASHRSGEYSPEDRVAIKTTVHGIREYVNQLSIKTS